MATPFSTLSSSSTLYIFLDIHAMQTTDSHTLSTNASFVKS